MIFISFKTTTGEQSGHTGTPVSYHDGIFLVFAVVFFHGSTSISLLFTDATRQSVSVSCSLMYKQRTPKCCDKGTSPQKPVVYLKFTPNEGSQKGL